MAGAVLALAAVGFLALAFLVLLGGVLMLASRRARQKVNNRQRVGGGGGSKGGPVAAIPPSKGSFGSKVFAPYLPVASIVDLAGGPCKFYTLAFVLADGANKPSWDGQTPLGGADLAKKIAALRAKGGDVIISCGGAAGSELGFVIKDAKKLQAAYQQVVDAYKLRWLDLDIEGGQLEPASVDVRNRAIAALQKANPGLMVSYTLSADTSGLNAPSKDLLANAKKNGVRVDCCNVMAMEMNQNNAANILAAVKAAKAQVDALGLGSKMGICIMIGVNDFGGPCSLQDAKEVAAFARKTPWVSWLSFWSVARDNGGCAGKKQADGACSGLSQAKYAFCQAMAI